MTTSNNNIHKFWCYSKYAQTIPRNFGVMYNPYTQCVEILDSKPQIQELIQNINNEIQFLADVIQKI